MKALRVGFALAVAAIVTEAIVTNNYVVGIAAVIAAVFLAVFLHRAVKEVAADEKDYKIAGDAARWSLTLSATLLWILSFIFMMMRGQDPVYELVGSILAYAVCGELLLYSFIYGYFARDSERGKQGFWFFLLALIVATVLAVAGVRFLTGEDTWICSKGLWVPHGQPTAPMPAGPCR